MTISWTPIPLLWPSWSIVRLVLTMLGHLKGQCENGLFRNIVNTAPILPAPMLLSPIPPHSNI